MVFNNSGPVHPQFNNLGSGLSSIGKSSVPTPSRSMSLNAPMVERVHKAKPGCSACGKKVA